MISDAYADLELARNIGMTRKRIAIVLGMVSLIGFLILRWIQRTPTEADDRDHPLITSAGTPAAVASLPLSPHAAYLVPDGTGCAAGTFAAGVGICVTARSGASSTNSITTRLIRLMLAVPSDALLPCGGCK